VKGTREGCKQKLGWETPEIYLARFDLVVGQYGFTAAFGPGLSVVSRFHPALRIRGWR